jgi:hypothetical protein
VYYRNLLTTIFANKNTTPIVVFLNIFFQLFRIPFFDGIAMPRPVR